MNISTHITLPSNRSAVSSPSGSREVAADEKVLGQYIPLLYHYNMLQDNDRVGAFQEAINLLVQPDMHVVELGGGTGILSSFAARRGAQVTCVERNPELVATSRRFLAANGLLESVQVVQADAARFVPNRPVDVVVCEMLHVGLLREKQANVIESFKRNYRRAMPTRLPDAVKLPIFVPEVSVLMVQLVEQSFDFAGFYAPVPMFQPPLQKQERTIEMSDLQPYANIAYGDSIPQHFDVSQRHQPRGVGHVNAIRLITQNILAVDEPAQRAITWPNQCLVLPLQQPFDVAYDQSVQVEFQYTAGDAIEVLQESLRVQRILVEQSTNHKTPN